METKGTVRPFFALGYSYVVFNFLHYMLFSLYQVLGVSTICALFAANTGIPFTDILSVNTYGTLALCVGIFAIAPLAKKIKLNRIFCVGFIILCITSFMWGHCMTIGAYTLLVIIQGFGLACIVQIGGNGLIANWFPRTRGTVFGITTIGVFAVSFIIVPIIKASVAARGFTGTMDLFAVFYLILGIVCLFWIKETPALVNMLPDNRPMEADAQKTVQSDGSYWTVKQLICSKTGIVYILLFGVLNLCNRGCGVISSSLITEFGYGDSVAKITMALAATACLGSFVLGVIDSKKGTKFATSVFSILFTIAMLCCFFLGRTNSKIGLAMWFLMYFGAGALANLMVSTLVNLYGAVHFNYANRYLTSLVNAIVALAYIIVAKIIAGFGGVTYSVLFFGALSIVPLILSFVIPDKYIPAPNKKEEAL
ncbi:MAG: MFS transporter [Lachnospiraceae bacterium]|nr:MFS transporter [Lachnospiraceae bacterium]